MIIGPIFVREAITLPRRARFYSARAVYVVALFVLMCTAWAVLAGTQWVRNLGDLARFGASLFQLLAPIQLALVVFWASLTAASMVTMEKDRRTMDLLLMTRLTNRELVLGKLFAGVLNVLVMIISAVPLFFAITLFGGVSYAQIARVTCVTVIAACLAGSWGCTVAFAREKTFQTLAWTALGLLLWVGVGESIYVGFTGHQWYGWSAEAIGEAISPLRAVLAAARPWPETGTWIDLTRGIEGFALLASALAVAISGWAIARVRVWNPSREARSGAVQQEEGSSIFVGPVAEQAVGQAALATRGAAVGVVAEGGEAGEADAERRRAEHIDARRPRPAQPSREVWDNPVLWREMCTWAYGRKVLAIRVVYCLLFLGVVVALRQITLNPLAQPTGWVALVPSAALVLAPFFVISFVIRNALAVTSITNERDGQALDLLLATDLTPAEFVFGKFLGVIWSTRETLVLPLVSIGLLWWWRGINSESAILLTLGFLTVDAFITMLGLHVGMTYSSSRAAVGLSLGTVFFLFLGVITCIAMMISFSGSFQTQLAPFLAFILGGSVGLFYALGLRNPSSAILLASLLLPWMTFNAITSFLLDRPLSAFLVVVGSYGFATAALMVPAISEFDIAMGRTRMAADAE